MSQRPSPSEYRRVRQNEEREKNQGPENEIRVTAKRGQRSYITYALALLKGEDGKTKYDTVKISGMGAAMFNVVNIAEILKRRVVGLHQINEISSEEILEVYEPIAGNKENLTVERKLPKISITLSTTALDTTNVGYQAPLPEEMVTEEDEGKLTEARRGGRGGRGGRDSGGESGERGEHGERGERGNRGRGGRRGGRGGSSVEHEDANSTPSGRRRGRGNLREARE